MTIKTLRPRQQEAYDKLRMALGNGYKRPLVQAPTGFGKTVLAATIARAALDRGNRIMFVCPAISLVDQTAESFYSQGITDIGVIQADHPLTNPAMPVQIASVQTLIRRKTRNIPHADIVLVDEAHNQFDGLYGLMDSWNKIPFVGLSATPWARGMGNHYDKLIIAATTQQLIDDGDLSPFRVFAPSHPDLSKVRVTAGDFNEGDLSKVMRGGSLVSDVVSNWIKNGEGRPTLCFGVDRLHAAALQESFQKAGIQCGYIDAYTNREERKTQMDALARGDLKVICNVGVMTTGVDIPEVACIILARPTKSEILYTQIIGRGLRVHEEKDYLLIFDHSDTTLRLGFVTDIHHEELSTAARLESKEDEDQERKPAECGECGFVKPPRTPICPNCQFQAPERVNTTEAAAGELAELEMGSATQRKHNRDYPNALKAEFMGGLKGIAEKKGYKPGWASNKYREKFGVWPNKYKDVPSCPANSDVSGFMKHQAIKNRHRRAS